MVESGGVPRVDADSHAIAMSRERFHQRRYVADIMAALRPD
jgi:hypothetical protein